MGTGDHHQSESGFLTERCGICCEIAEFAPPDRWQWSYRADTGTSSLAFFPDVTPICVRCTLEHGAAELKLQLTATCQEVMRRKRLIGLDDDATLYVTTSRPSPGSPDRFNGIHLTQYVVFYRGQVPEGSRVPGLWYRQPDGGTLPFATDQPFGMMWFGWDVARDNDAAVLQLSWNASDWTREGQLSFTNWSGSSAAALSRLLHVSEDFMHKTRGRPKDVTYFELSDYKRAFVKCRDHSQRRPCIHEVATELNQNRKTVTANLQRWGYRGYRDFATQTMSDE